MSRSSAVRRRRCHRPRRAAASSSGAYTCLTAVDTGHRLWIGMDTRDLELFHCPGTATPAAPRGVCTGTERNGSTANDQDIVTAAPSGAVEVRGATTRGSGTEPFHSGARQVLAERA